jgi:hypothetical protein
VVLFIVNRVGLDPGLLRDVASLFLQVDVVLVLINDLVLDYEHELVDLQIESSCDLLPEMAEGLKVANRYVFLGLVIAVDPVINLHLMRSNFIPLSCVWIFWFKISNAFIAVQE